MPLPSPMARGRVCQGQTSRDVNPYVCGANVVSRASEMNLQFAKQTLYLAQARWAYKVGAKPWCVSRITDSRGRLSLRVGASPLCSHKPSLPQAGGSCAAKRHVEFAPQTSRLMRMSAQATRESTLSSAWSRVLFSFSTPLRGVLPNRCVAVMFVADCGRPKVYGLAGCRLVRTNKKAFPLWRLVRISLSPSHKVLGRAWEGIFSKSPPIFVLLSQILCP